MPIGKQLFGYKRAVVDQYRENTAHERKEQLADIDQRIAECRAQIKGLLSQNERMIIELDGYNSQDRSIANRVWEQVKTLEEVRHQTGLQIREALNLTGDKLERLNEFYQLLDTIRAKIDGLSGEIAGAGPFGSTPQEPDQAADHSPERGKGIEVQAFPYRV